MNPGFTVPFRLVLRAHAEARVLDTFEVQMDGDGARIVSAFGCEWRIEATRAKGGDLWASVALLAGEAPPVSFGLLLPLTDWGMDVYTLMPGAVYAGNRFGCRRENYSPRYPEPDGRPDAETLVADIPRLAVEPGVRARVQLLTGDLAAPLFAARWPEGRTVVVMAPDAPGDALWQLEENAERTTACFALLRPGVRERKYRFAGAIRSDAESTDRGRAMVVGDSIDLRVRIEQTVSTSMAGLFERALDFFDELVARARSRHELPLAAAAALVEAKRNREDWAEELGLYRTTNLQAGQRHNVFQTGWCGGILAESALLAGGERESVWRAKTSLDTVCREAPRSSGWLAGKAHADGNWTADFVHDAARPWTHRRTLLRRQADALTYLLAAAERHEAAGLGAAPESWLRAARGLADAFSTLWEERGAGGHFIDIERTGEDAVVVGGSASAGLAPAGLVAAWRRFGEARHLVAAAGLGNYFYAQFTVRGVTTGGPADAMQAPDSESAAGLAESYVALHEAGAPGGDWLARAGEAAAQLASWAMPYDYAFPGESEFGRLGVPTVGSVFANAQNKHAAPGLCTHSGLFLLRLFRHRGDERYLRLLAAIARFLPWAVSRADRPIRAQDGRVLPEGWINERVNTSDWDENLGGVFYGSTWSEVSLLLTAAELPSVYAQPDTGLLAVLDHVEAEWADAERKGIRLCNPTRYPARVRLLVESSLEARTRLIGPGSALGWPLVDIPPGATAEWSDTSRG